MSWPDVVLGHREVLHCHPNDVKTKIDTGWLNRIHRRNKFLAQYAVERSLVGADDWVRVMPMMMVVVVVALAVETMVVVPRMITLAVVTAVDLASYREMCPRYMIRRERP